MKLYPGDILKAPPPAHPDIRYRVRDIEMVYPNRSSWGNYDYSKIDKIPCYSLQMFSRTREGINESWVWKWMDVSHDLRGSAESIARFGLELVESARVQMELF